VFIYTDGLGWDAGEVFAPLGPKATCIGDLDRLVEAIDGEATAGDQIVVMSNGGFGGIHAKLLERLAH
jgi:UDP-N-acetylmuramate: L-alanyl-gamma-D-glutamyl-meso-diaminopimelate ligase